MKTQLKMFLLALLILSGGYVVVQNVFEEKEINGLKGDVEALYRDRLLAESYIYNMSDLLHRKRSYYADAAHAGTEISKASQLQPQLSALIDSYQATRLTREEAQVFAAFLQHVRPVYMEGEDLFVTPGQAWAKITAIDAAQAQLKLLSDIQVKEGTVLQDRSGVALSGALVTLKLEWVLLVVMALLFITFLKDRILLPSALAQAQRN